MNHFKNYNREQGWPLHEIPRVLFAVRRQILAAKTAAIESTARNVMHKSILQESGKHMSDYNCVSFVSATELYSSVLTVQFLVESMAYSRAKTA